MKSSRSMLVPSNRFCWRLWRRNGFGQGRHFSQWEAAMALAARVKPSARTT